MIDKGKKGSHGVPHNIVNDSPPPVSPQVSPETLVIDTSSLSSPPEPPEPIMTDLSLPPAADSDLLARAFSELKPRPIRFPIVGQYVCFTNGGDCQLAQSERRAVLRDH
jgi:hypothetical protein